MNSATDQLVSYVSAIHGQSSDVAIVERTQSTESWVDQGFEVRKEETIFRFDNGVVIRRVVEQDDFPSDLACAECWIIYEVLQHGGCQVTPARRSFDNACRESYWLAFHRDG